MAAFDMEKSLHVCIIFTKIGRICRFWQQWMNSNHRYSPAFADLSIILNIRWPLASQKQQPRNLCASQTLWKQSTFSLSTLFLEAIVHSSNKRFVCVVQDNGAWIINSWAKSEKKSAWLQLYLHCDIVSYILTP